MATSAVLLRQLRAARASFGEPAELRKRELLNALAGKHLSSALQLVAYHEDLLFLVAFPGDADTHRAAMQELGRFERRCRRLTAEQRDGLVNTGMAGTVTRPSLAWPVIRAFAGEDVELEWNHVEAPEALDALVARLVSPAERESFEGGDYTTRRWVELARRTGERDLAWLIRDGGAARPQSELANAWDTAQVPLRWTLRNSARSVTHARLRSRRARLRTCFRRLTEAAAMHVARPLEDICRLGRPQAAEVVDLARSALAARAREVHAMNYPNLDEVYLADLGEGAELVLIGVPPAQRLTFEANYGYLLMSNGVPVGYGGVTPLYRQANTGINVFDPFRGSEAAFLWAQTLRTFRTLFGVRRFVINGYQFGAGNPEAIASGAYWFYLRLGFRPSVTENVELAAQELERLRREPAKRTPPATLRRLAQGDLHFDLHDFIAADFFDESLLTRIGAVLARRLAAGGDSSHREGEDRLIRQVERTLSLRQMSRWPVDERRGFRRLAPYAALMDIESWSASDRRALAAWLRTRGATAELDFAMQATRQKRFFRELRTLAQVEAERAS